MIDTMPTQYSQLDTPELLERIAARKAELGNRLVILGHHYQNDQVIQFADFRGDSLKLSQLAAEQDDAEFIVFCGVHFMAESADTLSSDRQTVCLPNLRAGCGMADMADEDDVADAIESIAARAGCTVLPVTYVNSTAGIKAVTADAGGACCTSSNVRNVFEWALNEGGAEKIFAIPDQHLARNIAIEMGYDEDDCVVFDPRQHDGGISDEQLARATFILWRGWCYVHQIFQTEHVIAAREDHPDATIIVHPECPSAVVARADAYGSTSQIIQAVSSAPAGSQWVIGTESNMVRRLAAENTDKTVHLLSRHEAHCIQMARIDLPHLLWCLDSIAEGQPVNVVTVADDISARARLALERMLAIRPVSGTSQAGQ